MSTVISISNVSKRYRLGTIGGGTLRADVDRWWARIRGKPDPGVKIGKENWYRDGGDVWALRDVSLKVNQGEVLGIVGRNGAGKSTLLKILSRVTAPTTGEVKIRGRIASLLEVGTGFHPELTGRENIYLNGAILGMTKAEVADRLDEIIAFSEVEQYIDTPVKRYSSGMYVRLAFAVAAHLQPEILIVDEVLAVGDAQFQRKCLGKMGDVARAGRTVLFVSHNMGAVRSLCSQALLFRSGRLELIGDVQDCVEAYLVQQGQGDRPILSYALPSHPDVAVSSVTVNGTSHDHVTLAPEERFVQVSMAGTLRRSIRMDIEVWLSDTSGTVLASFSRGHEYGETPLVPTGPFELTRTILLPATLHKGQYVLSMALTHHNVRQWVEFPRSVMVTAEGHTTRTGVPLEYRLGRGFFSLSEYSEEPSEYLDAQRMDHEDTGSIRG